MTAEFHPVDTDRVDLYVLVAIWPEADRKWTDDDRSRTMLETRDGDKPRSVAWSQEQVDQVARENAATAERAGIRALPSGRMWFLRPPSSWTGPRALERYIRSLRERAERRGGSGRSDDPAWTRLLMDVIASDFTQS